MSNWPVLRKFDSEHLSRISMPLGGIGTGSVSLGGRGDLRDWEIMNIPSKGFAPKFARGSAPFFAIRTKSGSDIQARALEGPLEDHEYEGSSGSPTPNHGLPRFRNCSFGAAYPFGQVQLSDPDMPVKVELEAFNPLIPGDVARSSYPVAILRYTVHNKTSKALDVSICGTVPNFIGNDRRKFKEGEIGACKNRNRKKKTKHVQGITMDSQGVHGHDAAWGTMAFCTTETKGISSRTSWYPEVHWGGSLLDFWDDFTDDGELDARTDKKTNSPAASVAIKARIPAKGSRTFTYIIAWHFPNRQTWSPDNDCDSACDCTTVNTIGNHYCEQFTDAWDAASKVAQNLKSLEQDSLKFVTSFCKSDYPDAVKDAALSNLAILKTQTCFRTPDGHFYGWEGVGPSTGCCSGSCTHVWNYEQAVAFLFSELSQSMRIVEFAHATNDEGCMSFRVNLPLDKKAMSFKRAAADGQMGCIMKIYRDWQLCGDDTFLKELWPNVKRSLEFCWVPGGWDADQDGVMEGCQHNTMDVEYYGPNPQMGCWYLGALRAAEEMASYLGDDAFADRCNDLFKRGSKWIDDELFNGEFYEHHVVAPKKGTDIHPSLAAGMGSDDLKEPEYQLANGCLVDQLVGQYMAHICGLGYLLKKSNIKKTLRSIYKYNRKSGFHDHFNSMRSYVLGDETALLMANYPKDSPKLPFPYFTEVMTGFEYTAAVGMLYEDLEKQGLQCIGDIRARYNGRHRNPFDEAECGRYYARAMASWAAIPALSDFLYSAVEQSIQFTEKSGTYFWSTGSAWGNAIVTKTGLKLTVEFGSIKIKSIQLGQRQSKLKTASSLSKGRSKLFKI